VGVTRPGRLPSLSPISNVESSENGGKTGKNPAPKLHLNFEARVPEVWPIVRRGSFI